MATAKQRAEWYRAAVMTAHLMRVQIAKGTVNELKLIPPQYRPPRYTPKVSAAQQQEDTRRVLDALERRATGKVG